MTLRVADRLQDSSVGEGLTYGPLPNSFLVADWKQNNARFRKGEVEFLSGVNRAVMTVMGIAVVDTQKDRYYNVRTLSPFLPTSVRNCLLFASVAFPSTHQNVCRGVLHA
jgi:hypothetical protein